MSKSPEVVVSLTLAIHDEAQKATPSSKVWSSSTNTRPETVEIVKMLVSVLF